MSSVGPSAVRVSTVILAWDSGTWLGRCLHALREGTAGSLEVIVIDNGSRVPVGPEVADIFPHARIIRNVRNRGVAAARNQGLRLAVGSHLLLLDVDAEVRPGAVDRLADYLDAHPDVGIAGPRLISPTGALQYSCRRFPTVLTKVLRRVRVPSGRRLLDQEEYRWWDHARPRDVDYVIGACQAIRRETLEQLKGLDESMFYGPEDVDFCLRAWRAGWRVAYVPGAEVVHHEQRITRRLWSRLTWLHALAMARYFRKHGYWISREKVYRTLARPQPEVEM